MFDRLVLLSVGLIVFAYDWTTASLWLAVAASGLYHGVNPGMGWPLAVSAGLMGRGRRDLLIALGPIAAGHCIAMASILLPFAAMTLLIVWQYEIRFAAALVVIVFGVYLSVNRRHPRFLARIKPSQLTLWSFAVAMAHGAGLMLLPIYLGLCKAEELDQTHRAATALMASNLVTATIVSIVHTAAMILSGGMIAFTVHQWLGPAFISKSWFNLGLVWALSLILVGSFTLASMLFWK